MAKVIKKLKMKKPDETMSDYIPIGAEAENVNVDGESVEIKLNKTPYYYNSVADMKADAKLKVDDMAITLGYYEANDGGGAEYKIVNGNYTDDGGSYHELENNLFAELVIKDSINIKQFGAYGDDNHNDTNAIQKAINFSSTKKKELILIKGIYKISSTINMNEDTCLVPINKVIFKCYYNGICLQLNEEVETTNINIIKGNGQLRIQSTAGISSNSIGIQIGNENATKSLNDISLNNLVINNFNIGIKIMNKNNWNINFEKCDFFYNYYGLYYGGTSHVNAGERINIENSVFTQNKVDVYVSSTLWSQMNFHNCSFDFSDCMFWVDWSSPNYSANNNKISISQCHIEGIGKNLDGVPDDTPMGILYGYSMYSLVFSIEDSTIVISKNYYWFKMSSSEALRNGLLILDNVFVINDFLNDKIYPTLAINIKTKTNNIEYRWLPNAIWSGQSSSRQVIIPVSSNETLNLDPMMTELTEGSYAITANTQIGNFVLKSPNALLSINCITQALYGQNNKYLDFQFDSNYSGTYNASCQLESGKIKVKPNSIIAPIVYTNNSGDQNNVSKSLSCSLKYFNSNDEQIGATSFFYIPAAPGMINDDIISLLPSATSFVPANTDYTILNITIRNGTAGNIVEHRIVRGIFLQQLT